MMLGIQRWECVSLQEISLFLLLSSRLNSVCFQPLYRTQRELMEDNSSTLDPYVCLYTSPTNRDYCFDELRNVLMVFHAIIIVCWILWVLGVSCFYTVMVVKTLRRWEKNHHENGPMSERANQLSTNTIVTTSVFSELPQHVPVRE